MKYNGFEGAPYSIMGVEPISRDSLKHKENTLVLDKFDMARAIVYIAQNISDEEEKLRDIVYYLNRAYFLGKCSGLDIDIQEDLKEDNL